MSKKKKHIEAVITALASIILEVEDRCRSMFSTPSLRFKPSSPRKIMAALTNASVYRSGEVTFTNEHFFQRSKTRGLIVEFERALNEAIAIEHDELAEEPDEEENTVSVHFLARKDSNRRPSVLAGGDETGVSEFETPLAVVFKVNLPEKSKLKKHLDDQYFLVTS